MVHFETRMVYEVHNVVPFPFPYLLLFFFNGKLHARLLGLEPMTSPST
jgi:hypothetical protein